MHAQFLSFPIVVFFGFSSAQAQLSAPLFESHDELELTLTAPVRTLERNKRRRPVVDGVLSYENAEGKAVALDLEITTRGNSRLDVCSFPPLWFDLRRSQLEGTVFEGQNRLKVVTRCKTPRPFEDYLQLEYLAYRIHNHITEFSFRVRPVRITYVDTDRSNREEQAPAFLIEHIDGVAGRTGTNEVEIPSVRVSELSEPELTEFWLFQFLIGNTDVSDVSASTNDDECCHNAALLQGTAAGSRLIAVPFDFDQAGVVDTEYAMPNEQLNLRSVRERMYRGRCPSNQYLDAAIARFNSVRPEILSLLETAALGERRRDDTIEYVQEGFEILNDREEVESQILGQCRNRGTESD